ncbi:cobalamin B12-binding domain-containing protein, partial [Pradoshia sp.]
LLKAKKAEETTLELLQDSTDDNPDGRFKQQINELYTAVLELEADKCNRLLDLYFSQFNYHTVFYSIIVPLMYKVGEEWEKGNLHVVKEHMISNIIMQRSIRFFSIFESSPNLPRIMAICPRGEQHQLGLILFTLFLREKHYPVYYIGADTPLEGLADLIKEKDISILAISTSRQADLHLVESYIDTIRKMNPSLKYLVGGLGIKETKMTDYRFDIAPNDQNWEQIMDLIAHSPIS